MYEVLNVIKDELVGFGETYQIPWDFHLYALRPEDRVTSDPTGCLAVYEDLYVGLCFLLYHFIFDVLHQYDVIPT